MKRRRDFFIGLLVFGILCAAIYGFFIYQNVSTRNTLAERIVAMGNNRSPQTIEDIRAAIAAYEDRIEQHVKDAAQAGIYWKILASRLQDQALHEKALEALETAIYYYPDDAALQYMTGVSAALTAKGSQDFGSGSLQDRYLDLSESAFLRAIAMDASYAKPRYGLGVLYVFDLNRPEEAVPHLTKFLDLVTDDIDGMFVLARAYYMMADYQTAADLYERIMRVTKDADKRGEAAANRETVLDLLYG